MHACTHVYIYIISFGPSVFNAEGYSGKTVLSQQCWVSCLYENGLMLTNVCFLLLIIKPKLCSWYAQVAMTRIVWFTNLDSRNDMNDMTWYEMMWNDMKWYKTIWNDMKWYETIWNDMKWYKMIWNDMKWYETIWNDMKWYKMIWNDRYEMI